MRGIRPDGKFERESLLLSPPGPLRKPMTLPWGWNVVGRSGHPRRSSFVNRVLSNKSVIMSKYRLRTLPSNSLDTSVPSFYKKNKKLDDHQSSFPERRFFMQKAKSRSLSDIVEEQMTKWHRLRIEQKQKHSQPPSLHHHLKGSGKRRYRDCPASGQRPGNGSHRLQDHPAGLRAGGYQ